MKKFLDKYLGTTARCATLYSVLASLDITILSIALDKPIATACGIFCSILWCYLYLTALKED